jgi:ferrous iron transport protein B
MKADAQHGQHADCVVLPFRIPLAFLTATMLFVPCVATMAAMRLETGSWRRTLYGVALLLVVALGGATLVDQACRLLGLGVV